MFVPGIIDDYVHARLNPVKPKAFKFSEQTENSKMKINLQDAVFFDEKFG